MDDERYLSFETERLLLRPTLPEDAPLILEMLNTPKWLEYIGDRHVHNLNEAEAYIQKRMLPQLQRSGYSNYTLILKHTHTKIGVCGLYDREGLEGIDIGFALLPQYEQQGFAYEATSRILRAAFENFNITVVQAITTHNNHASQRLLEKLGMQCIGTTRLPDDDEELLLYKLILK
ncbi:MAG: GNAT family N-acetyltransferase [Sphingobacteriales bacterium]|nr:GNAT family N-acetyltransferase [Sphingobacteriales bacterium]